MVKSPNLCIRSFYRVVLSAFSHAKGQPKNPTVKRVKLSKIEESAFYSKSQRLQENRNFKITYTPAVELTCLTKRGTSGFAGVLTDGNPLEYIASTRADGRKAGIVKKER